MQSLSFDSLLRTYIEKDVLQTGVRNIKGFEDFLTVLASRIGQEFSVCAVAAEANISIATAKEWLSIVEASGIIYLLPPFYENVAKTVIKKPKLYFTDTGFAAWLCNSPLPESLKTSFNAGFFFENFVIMEIIKGWVHNGRKPHFYHYRDTRRNEVDLLIREGTQYFPIGIKHTASPNKQMADAFKHIKGGNFTCGFGTIICLCDEQHYLASDLIAKSIWDL